MRKPRKNYTPVDPTGTPLGDAICRDEGILYAKIDLARSVEPKQFHDVVGSYNRFDIFSSHGQSLGTPSGDICRRAAGLCWFEDSPGSRSRRPGYGVVPYFPPSSTLKRYPIYAAK